FGQSPEGRLRSDTMPALIRVERGDGNGGNASLISTLDKALALSFDPLDCHLGQPWQGPRPALQQARAHAPWRTCGDTRERLELLALALIEQGLDGCLQLPDEAPWQPVRSVLQTLVESVAPNLDGCGAAELDGLLAALAGRFVPAGPSGVP